jgi:hypothetical protein
MTIAEVEQAALALLKAVREKPWSVEYTVLGDE